jgi:hypothetical protein
MATNETTNRPTKMRVCKKCKIEKPLSPTYYYRLGDGFEKVCKDCRNDRPNSYLPKSTEPAPEKKTRKRETGSVERKPRKTKKS